MVHNVLLMIYDFLFHNMFQALMFIIRGIILSLQTKFHEGFTFVCNVKFNSML
jgi:hypothetical protein